MGGEIQQVKCAAILVAAGSSRRMGFDKLAADLAGQTVLRRTFEAFLAAESVVEIILVGPVEREKLLGGQTFQKPLRRVAGGAERQDSVAAGLAAISEGIEWVAIHDGARPLISPADIDRCVAEAELVGAAAMARRVTETLKRADDEDYSMASVAREGLWFMETPQVFRVGLIREAYAAVRARGLVVTDEVSAVETLGKRVKLVESRLPNLKITTPADLALAEALLS
jgi:2-C-methyl-D-erythritol 4-phosphate cytidylyltransferase